MEVCKAYRDGQNTNKSGENQLIFASNNIVPEREKQIVTSNKSC
jgi:hypothetical protein